MFGQGLTVGAVTTKVGFDYDRREADAFGRDRDRLRAEARTAIRQEIKTDYDRRGLDAYQRGLHGVDRSQQDLVRGSGRLRTAVGSLFIGGAAFAGAATAIYGAAKAGTYFVGVASDINESLSKNRVLFGEHAREVEKFAEASAEGYGIARSAALEYTGTFGNLFRALGVSRGEAAKTSIELTKLAADMASFNNSTPEEALEALRSGLVGETEPLRRFGVNLSDAQLRVQAVKLGLVDSTKNALDPHAKALAAVALATKQTATAHGDFARTSGGLANQTKILKAQISDVAGEIGAKLLPFVKDAAVQVNKWVKEWRDGKGPLQDIQNAVVGVGKAMLGAGRIILGALRPVISIVRGTANVVGDLWREFREGNAVVRALVGALGGAAAAFGALKVGQAVAGMGLLAGAIAKVRGALALLRANPLIAVITAAGALVGALVGLASRQRSASEAADDHRNALNKLRDAMTNAADAELRVKEARQQARSAALAVKEAETSLRQTRHRTGKDSLETKRAEEDLRAARLGSRRANFEVKRAEDELTDSRRKAGKASDNERRDRGRANKEIGEEIERRKDLIAGYRRQIEKQKESGDATDITRARLKNWREAIKSAREELRDLEKTQDRVNRTFLDANVDKASKAVDKARGAYKEARGELGRYEKGTDKWREANERAERSEGKLRDAVDKKKKAVADARSPIEQMIRNSWGLGVTVADTSSSIGSNVNSVLNQVGADPFSFAIRRPPAPTIRATGGIPHPGSGARDDHVLIAPDGRPVALMSGTEGILNTPQMSETNRVYAIAHALGATRYRGLGDLWSSGMRHHAGGGPIGPYTVTGPPGAMRNEAQGAANTMRNSANDYLDDKVRAFMAAQAGGAGDVHGLVPQVLRAIAWARAHGWSGTVVSGFRSLAEQTYLWNNRASNPNPVAPPGTSNHESGQAIDVSDTPGFLAAMRSAPPDSRLIWYGPGDPPHFSITGHALGGLLRFAGGGKLSGKEKAARKEARQQRHKANVQHHADVGKGITKGARKSIQRVAHGLGIYGFEQRIQDLETKYGQKDRLFGLSDEDVIIENEDGSTSIDTTAQKKREDELDDLIEIRKKIRKTIRDYIDAIKTMVKAYGRAIGQLTRALKHAGGRGRGEERSGYRTLINDYSQRIRDLQHTAHDLGFDLTDVGLDLKELRGEKAEITGAKGTAAPAGDTGGDTGGDVGTGGTDPAAVAAAALQQFQAFQQGRKDLFASFGNNAVSAGTAAFGGPLQQAAGFSYFGAANQPVGADAVRAAREGGIHITINAQDIGSDATTWAGQVKHELTAV